ncbi:transient receptor potential cation channel protein painless-like [Chironomus tepperi]|uniref:transient receptor potential cation channel protein painless-like n=1 Tax=Chironomus tepperi TaxID=113505 RepID=UPI00391F6C6A
MSSLLLDIRSRVFDVKTCQNALHDAFNRKNLHDFKFALERLKANPNAIIDDRIGASIFKLILREPNSSEYIELCIEHGADLYENNKVDLRPPIFYVIESFSPENLEIFFKNFDSSRSNVKYGDKNSLHLLIKEVTNDNFSDLSACIKILLENGVNLNTPDDHSRTPFFMLLKVQQKVKKCQELIEFVVDNYAVDVYSYKSDEMLTMFKAQNPSLKIPEKIEADLTFDFMRNLLLKRNDEKFIKSFKNFKSKNFDDENFHEFCAEFVYEAVRNGSDEVIVALNSEGINVNQTLSTAVKSPAELACSYGYHKVLQAMIKSVPTSENLLHQILHASYQKSSKNSKINHQKCFEIALPYCDVNKPDDLGSTPLHYAAHHRNSTAVLKLLEMNAFLAPKNKFHETPLDDMKADVLEQALDSRVEVIQVPKDMEQKELNISIDFNILKPPGSSGEAESLEIMSKNAELRPLIAHVVIATFIFLKWKRLSLIFYTNFIMFTVLMLTFIRYIIMSHTMSDDEKFESLNFKIFKILSFFGIFMLFLRELFQLLLSMSSNVSYFKSPINIFEIIFIILAFLSQILENSIDFNEIRVLRAFTILCAAFEFLHLVGELPFLSISCHMVILQKVAFTFLKSLLLYSILLVAFALSFFVLFGGDNEEQNGVTEKPVPESSETTKDDFTNFAYPGIAIIKTFVMLTGEFDAAAMSLHSKGAYYCIMFLLFIFVVTIVLFNLLSALAVDDTQKIKAEGELIDLCARIKVLRKYEKMIMGKMRGFGFWKRFEHFVTVFPQAMPDGKIYIQPNKGYLVTSKQIKQSPSETFVEIEDDDGDFGCIKSKLKMTKDSKCCLICNRLDSKIGKKIRNILDARKEKELMENERNSMAQEIKDMRAELRDIKDILNKKCFVKN